MAQKVDKEQQKKLLIELMELDEKDATNNIAQTAMQTLIAWGDEMLLKHPQKILSFGEAIDKAVELLQLEKKQIVNAQMDMFHHLNNLPFGLDYITKRDEAEKFAKKYKYNETKRK